MSFETPTSQNAKVQKFVIDMSPVLKKVPPIKESQLELPELPQRRDDTVVNKKSIVH